MPQKEPLPQNGGTTPPAPEIAQSGRLLMHVLRLHRKARVGFFENLLLPCAAPAAPADPKAVRQKGEGGLTRRKKRRAAGASCRAAFFRTSVRRRMRETQSVRRRTESAFGSTVRGRKAVSSRRHKKKAGGSTAHGKARAVRRYKEETRFLLAGTRKKARAVRRRAGKRGRIDGVLRICDSPAPLSVRRQAFRSPRPRRGGKSRPPRPFSRPARVFRRTGPPPERASRRRQSEAPGGFVQNGH